MVFVIVLIAVAIPMLAGLAIGLLYALPAANRFFSILWEDPADKQRAVIARRLRELHVDGDVPTETSILLAAKEATTSEKELLGLLDMVGPTDLMGVLSDRRKPLSAVLNGITRVLKRRS